VQAANVGESCYLGFDRTRNSTIRSANPENYALEPNMKWIGSPVVEIWSFEYCKMAAGRHLEFDRTGNDGIRLADPESPTLERNMK